jgi:hypothetical protein
MAGARTGHEHTNFVPHGAHVLLCVCMNEIYSS